MVHLSLRLPTEVLKSKSEMNFHVHRLRLLPILTNYALQREQ